MKKIFLAALLAPLSAVAGVNTGGEPRQTERDNTRLSLYIPGFLMDVGSWFINKDEDAVAKEALKKVRSISLCVREGDAYNEYQSRKYDRKMERLQKQGFEEMVSVVSAGENVFIQLRQNKKDKIRQVVVLADDGKEEFVFVRARCNFSMDDLKKWMNDDGDGVRELVKGVAAIE